MTSDHVVGKGPRLLFYLLEPDLRGGGWVNKNQRHLARAFGVTRETINRWFKELVEAGLIESTPRHENNLRLVNAYRLGPNAKNVTTSTCKEGGVPPETSIPSPETSIPSPPCIEHQGIKGGESGEVEEGQGARESGVGGDCPGQGVREGRGSFLDHCQGSHVAADSYATEVFLAVDHFVIRRNKRGDQIKAEGYRRRQWQRAATRLMVCQQRPLAEVMEVIDCAFDHTEELAHLIGIEVELNGWDFWRDWGDGLDRPIHLTGLGQIAAHYPLILGFLKRMRAHEDADNGEIPQNPSPADAENVQSGHNPPPTA